MEMRDAGYFMALVRCGSVQKAADELYISPQGLRKSIRRLESELDCNLFDPQLPNWKLTEEGRIFLDYARTLERETKAMRERIGQERDKSDHIVRVMVAPHTRELIRSTVDSAFQAAHPQVTVVLEEAVDSVCERKLDDARYSFGILQSPYNASLFDVEEIFTSNFYLWMSEDDPYARRSELTLADLDGQKVCLLDSTHKAFGTFTAACTREGVAPLIRQTNDTIWIAKEVLDGGGYGLILAHYPDAFGLVKRPIADFFWGLAICRPKDRMLSDDALALVRALRKGR